MFDILTIIFSRSNGTYSSINDFSFRNLEAAEMCRNRTCRTEGCIREGLHLRNMMNENIDPCDNFYEFVCGKFIKERKIPNEASTTNMVTIAQSKLFIDMSNEIMSNISVRDIAAFKKTKIYYQNCVNETYIELAGTKPLFEILQKIGGFPVLMGDSWIENNFDWINSVYKIKDQQFVVFFPITVSIEINLENSSKYIININSAQTRISRTYLLNNENSTFIESYYNFMIKVATALGANQDAAQNEMKNVLDFEINLYNIKTPPEVLLNDSQNGKTLRIQELSLQHPSIPWLQLLNKILNPSDIFINESEIVYIPDPNFIVKLEKLISNTPKRVLANYLTWNVIYTTIMYMPEKLRSIALEFFNTISGTTRSVNKSIWCINEIMEGFPISLNAMYIKKGFSEISKRHVFFIWDSIKKQMKKNLEEVDWMDNKTREAALEKLAAMDISISCTDELMDDEKVNDYYKDLIINPGIHLESAFNLTSFLEKQNFRTLRKSPKKKDWKFCRNEAIVNAYSVLQKNIVEISAGYLRSFFRNDRPYYSNYGSVGSLMGHEITHGFDNHGRKFDKNGNQCNWWQSETEEKFFKKAKCMIDLYNDFLEPQTRVPVNGVLTQGENIADHGGFKAAYHAYNSWTREKKIFEPCLPNMNYTSKQMYWISAASNWCSLKRSEYIKDMLSTDEHSPEIARILVSFSNIKEFAEDFRCKVGSTMNPEKKCIVW